jgi:hypothetical protein
MHREGDEVHIETDQARGGATPHIVRWVLVISLALLVVLFTLTFVIGSNAAQDGRTTANVSDESAAPDAS